MTTELDAIRALQAAQTDPSEATMETLKATLSESVQFAGLGGRSASGIEATLEALKDPQVATLMAQAQWGEPTIVNGTATVTAKLAPGMQIGGATITLGFSGGQISTIAYEMLPAPPVPPAPLSLTDTMKEAINTALTSGNPMLLGYVRPDGYPSLSYRGSTHVWSDTALAVWVRNPDGGLLAALNGNDHLTFWYRRSDPVTVYQFWGRARVHTDEETREKVFTGSPEAEQRMDTNRRGIPIIVELERIEGRQGREMVRMDRSAG